jgi:F-type H+-transporting ATPase subunit gamma
LFISSIILQALLESSASEMASRMTAMSAACQNADEMIQKLTIEYNKARQAMITQELTEIVGGSLSINK